MLHHMLRAAAGNRGGVDTLDFLFSGGDSGVAFDFTDKTTLFTDTAGTTQITTSGELARRANDVSGNGHYCIVPSDTYRPTYTESGGVSYLDCSGDGFYIPSSRGLFNYIHENTGSGIAMLFSASFNGGLGRTLGNYGSSANRGFSAYADDRGGFEPTDGLNVSVVKASPSNFLYQILKDNTVSQGATTKAIINIQAGGPLEMYIDGTLESTDTQNGSASVGDAESDMGIGILSDYLTSYPLVGTLRCVIVRDSPFTASEQDFIDSYFNQIQGL